jgi:hypothetical protein
LNLKAFALSLRAKSLIKLKIYSKNDTRVIFQIQNQNNIGPFSFKGCSDGQSSVFAFSRSISSRQNLNHRNDNIVVDGLFCFTIVKKVKNSWIYDWCLGSEQRWLLNYWLYDRLHDGLLNRSVHYVDEVVVCCVDWLLDWLLGNYWLGNVTAHNIKKILLLSVNYDLLWFVCDLGRRIQCLDLLICE